MSPARLSRKDGRDIHALLLELGYEQQSANGHVRYHKDGEAPYIMANSPSDRRWRANALAELRRRHPDAAVFQRRKAPAGRRRSRKRREPRAPMSLLVVEATPEAPPVPLEDDCTCGREWLSDLSPVGRRCPNCDGWVVRPA